MKVSAIFVAMALVGLSACSEHDHGDSGSAAASHDHSAHDDGGHEASAGAPGEPVASMGGLAFGAASFADEAVVSGEVDYTASIKFTDSTGAMLTGVTLTSVTPWMPGMGHGSDSPNLNFHQHDEMGHHWMVMGLRFSMPGMWILKVGLEVGGAADEVHLPLPKID